MVKSQSVRVFIATTQGLVEVLGITDLPDPDLQSVVSINHTSTLAGINRQYLDFVESPQGIIKQDFGGLGYRVNISSNIDQGESWQLPIYIAHYLHSKHLLASSAQKTSDVKQGEEIIIIASGRVDTTHKHVLDINALDRKCLVANNDIRQWQQQNAKVLFVVPSQSLRSPAPDSNIQLTPIANLHELPTLTNVFLSPVDKVISASINDEAFSQALETEDALIIEDNEALEAGDEQISSNIVLNNKSPISDGKGQAHFLKIAVLSFIAAVMIYALYDYLTPQNQYNEAFFVLSAKTSTHSNCNLSNQAIIDANRLHDFSLLTSSQFNKKQIALCELSFLTDHTISQILLVSESKAIISLNKAPMSSASDIARLINNNEKARFINELGHQQSFIQWSIPLPDNQSVVRSYYLLVFDEKLDKADLQSLDEYLHQLHNADKVHTYHDLRQWNDKARLEKNMFVIQHQLIF